VLDKNIFDKYMIFGSIGR